MDFETAGLAASYQAAHFDPMAPWWRVVGSSKDGSLRQPRLNPALGGGRRMRHPFYSPIVYPRLPDRTVNFLDDPIVRTRTVVTKTLSSAAVDHFQDTKDATVITEIWGMQTGNELTTLSSFFRALYRYRTDPLPVGQYLGWCPRDLSPKNFFIQLLDVRLGSGEDYVFEELGAERPYMMREALRISFKLVREAKSPTGVSWAEGV